MNRCPNCRSPNWDGRRCLSCKLTIPDDATVHRFEALETKDPRHGRIVGWSWTVPGTHLSVRVSLDHRFAPPHYRILIVNNETHGFVEAGSRLDPLQANDAALEMLAVLKTTPIDIP